jgi:hypothetical protein
MASRTKGKIKGDIKATSKIINQKVQDYGNELFFVKKAEASKKFLEKHGFPKEIKEIVIKKLA